MKNLDAIIFDMDGVIVDSEALKRQAAQATFAQYGVTFSQKQMEKFVGWSAQSVFEGLVKEFDHEHKAPPVAVLIAESGKRYHQLIEDELELFQGSREFLEKARGRGLRLALVTSSTTAMQTKVFDKHQLRKFFDVVVTENHIKKPKPDPEPYLKALDKLGISADQAVIVEDSYQGVLAAKAAGCRAIGLTHSFPQERLQKAGADEVLDSFTELEALLFN